MKKSKEAREQKKIYDLNEKLIDLEIVYKNLKPAEKEKNLERYKKIQEKIKEELSVFDKKEEI